MDIVKFLIAALAVYRVSRMVATERGAFNLFENMRGKIFDRFGESSWVFDGITCPLCISFWVALLASLFLPFNTATDFVFQWLGLTGLASFLYKVER